MAEKARMLRSETSELVGDYLELEKKFRALRLFTKQTMKEAEEQSQHLDEVIYLKKVINHLEDADRNLQYLPCIVKTK